MQVGFIRRKLRMAAVNLKLNPVGLVLAACALAAVLFYVVGLPMLRSRDTQTVSMKELLSVSIDLAQKGGVKVKAIRESADMHEKEKGKTLEGVAEMKTDGDMQSHREIVYGFAKAFPGLTVISEEHETKPVDFRTINNPNKKMSEVTSPQMNDQQVLMSDITVWIDPLDATQEYTENLRQYVTTMVCVAVKGKPVIGVIHNPFSKETSWAWEGYGHSKNLKVKPQSDADDKRIIVSRSHAGSVETVAKEALGKNTEVIPAGGAGYKTVEVIKGNADAYVHVTRIKKWDICPGNAIIAAMGGQMTTLLGEEVDYSAEGSAICDDGLLATIYDHNKLLKALKPAKADSTKH